MNPPVNRSSESPQPKKPKKTKPPASQTEPTEVIKPEITQFKPSEVVSPSPSIEVPTIAPQEPEIEVTPFTAKLPQPPQATPNPVATVPNTVIPADAPIATPKPSKLIKLKPASDSESSPSPEAGTDDAVIDRNQPIPPPSHPRQYRAIGLVYGQYQREEEQLTKGNILTQDGTALDAVVLGRVISLVKNHLDLEKPHLWVVYPRTRQEDDHLHVQIVGVWEPETLKQETPEGEESPAEITPEVKTSPNPGYFSIRGEVIFASLEEETVIIKIRQSPKKDEEKPKFFKLKLKGTLPSNRPFKRFWDLQVQLEGSSLMIEQGEDLGFASKRKPFDKKGGGRPFGQKRYNDDTGKYEPGTRPSRPEAKPQGTDTQPLKRPLPSKPIKGDQGKTPE